LELKHREIDLVIPRDKDMDDLIKIIVYSINTCDNNADSALFIKKKLEREKEKMKYNGNDIGMHLHEETND